VLVRCSCAAVCFVINLGASSETGELETQQMSPMRMRSATQVLVAFARSFLLHGSESEEANVCPVRLHEEELSGCSVARVGAVGVGVVVVVGAAYGVGCFHRHQLGGYSVKRTGTDLDFGFGAVKLAMWRHGKVQVLGMPLMITQGCVDAVEGPVLDVDVRRLCWLVFLFLHSLAASAAANVIALEHNKTGAYRPTDLPRGV